MPIFKINNQKFETISEKKIDLERDIQKLTEHNLEAVFGLKFVSGSLNQEFSVHVNEQDFYNGGEIKDTYKLMEKEIKEI